MNHQQAIRLILETKTLGVVSQSPETTVHDAVALMIEKGVGAVLVMRGEQLLGIVSERDCARRVLLQDGNARQVRLRDIMSSPVLTASPEDSAESCMATMTEKRVRHLPVVDDGKVVGVLSIGDIVKWLLRKQDETIHHLENYITGAYPG